MMINDLGCKSYFYVNIIIMYYNILHYIIHQNYELNININDSYYI